MDKNIYGLTDIYPGKPRYLDASVCATLFYRVAKEWWNTYEAFESCYYKQICLKEYHKWLKYARIFGKG